MTNAPGRAVIVIAALAVELGPVTAELRRRGIKPAAVCQSGVGSERAVAALDQVMQRWIGPLERVLHIGFAGGLDPARYSGEVMTFSNIVNAKGLRIPTLDSEKRLELLSLTDPLLTPADKRSWWQRTGAVAVDQESFAVARYCQAHELPLRVMRTITDTADDTLPAGVARWVDPYGRSSPLRVAADLVRSPCDLPAVCRLARGSRRADAALAKHVAADLGAAPTPR